jgi:membrane protein implicated in regulation of membrane protease activity
MFDFSVEVWLVVGLVSLVLEFAKLPGIGFLFIGLGALTNAILIYIYPEFTKVQYAYFGLLSFLWLAVLWWPLKKYARSNHKKQEVFDIVGSQAQVVSMVLEPGMMGQIKWSGTIMNARLDSSETEPVKADQTVYIKRMEGNVAILSRHN